MSQSVVPEAGLRICYVGATSPWPPRTGGHLRTIANLESLASLGAVRFLLCTPQPQPPVILPAAGGPDVRVFPVARPRANRRAWEWTRAVMSGQHPYLLRARDAGVIGRVIGEVARFRADVVVLEFPFYPGVATAFRATGAFVVADAADDRLGVALGLLRVVPSLAMPRLFAEALVLARSERRLSELDQVWYAAPEEAQRAAHLAPGRVRVVPNVVDVASIVVRAQRAPAYPRSAVFLGSFGYQPNVRAAIRFATTIGAEIRRLDPDARLAIVGRGPTRAIISAARAGEVDVLADVPDAVVEISRYGVLVVPLGVAGGTRLKILEAFAAGVPVVATAVAAAGLGARNGVEFLAAERDADIARATVALWDDRPRADRIREAAHRLVRDRYDLQSAHRAVREALAERRPRAR